MTAIVEDQRRRGTSSLGVLSRLGLGATLLAMAVLTAPTLTSAQTTTRTAIGGVQTPIGGSTDTHGCLVGAGYQWCDSLQKCVRVWETPCPTTATERAPNCAETLDLLISEGKCAGVAPNGTVSPGLPGAYCPQCAGNGDYLAEQCWGSTGQCWCVHTDTGAKINGTTANPGQPRPVCTCAGMTKAGNAEGIAAYCTSTSTASATATTAAATTTTAATSTSTGGALGGAAPTSSVAKTTAIPSGSSKLAPGHGWIPAMLVALVMLAVGTFDMEKGERW